VNRDRTALIWGAALVVLGLVLLGQSLDLIGSLAPLVWTAVFGLAGLAFVYVYLSSARARWWAIIPGLSLLGLAALMGLEAISPTLGGLLGAPIFLASIGLSFLLVYLTQRTFWWAVLPCGVMFSVAIVVLVEQLNPPFDAGAVVLLGLSATFLAVSRLATVPGQFRWPLIPAAVLGIIGLAILAESASGLGLIWPLILIAAGSYVIVRNLRLHPRE